MGLRIGAFKVAERILLGQQALRAARRSLAARWLRRLQGTAGCRAQPGAPAFRDAVQRYFRHPCFSLASSPNCFLLFCGEPERMPKMNARLFAYAHSQRKSIGFAPVVSRKSSIMHIISL